MSNSLVEVKQMLQVPSVAKGTYGIAIRELQAHLSPERAFACAEDLTRLGEIEQVSNIESLRAAGALTAEDELRCHNLSENNINPNQFTLGETQLVYEYVTNDSPEVVQLKVESIMDILANIIHGQNERRDFGFNEEKAELLQFLLDKGCSWERGQYDTSRGFDIERYPNDSYITPRPDLESYALTLTLEDLLDGDYICEDDVYTYGPYTLRDLKDMEYFVQFTWTTATGSQVQTRLEALIEDQTSHLSPNIGNDLTRAYISQIVLSARRLSARNLLSVAGAFGKQCQPLLAQSKKLKVVEVDSAELRKYLKLASHYIRQICRWDKEALKRQWGTTRPVALAFYQNVINLAEGWTARDEADAEKDFNGALIQLDDHLFRAQAAYADIMASVPQAENDKKTALFQNLLPSVTL